MNKPRILFWHRKDLRIFDNQALTKHFHYQMLLLQPTYLIKITHTISMQVQELGF